MLIPLLSVAVVLALAVLGVTQIVLPAVKGEPMFPLFLSDRRGLEVDLSQAAETLDNVELHRAIETAKRDAVRRMEEPLDDQEIETSQKTQKNRRK